MATVVVSADAFVRSHGARKGQGALRLRKPKFPGGGVHLVLLAGVSLLALNAFNKWESEQDYLYDEELKEHKPSSASEGSLYTNPTGAAAGTLIPPSFPGPDRCAPLDAWMSFEGHTAARIEARADRSGRGQHQLPLSFLVEATRARAPDTCSPSCVNNKSSLLQQGLLHT